MTSRLCPLCNADNPPAAFGCLSCGAPLAAAQNGGEVSMALPGGTLLSGGAYRVDGVLGQGGFGITYRGRDVQLKRDVAIKEYFPLGCARGRCHVTPHAPLDESTFGAGRNRFLDEARLVAQFEHRGIVRVLAAWKENGTAYFAMELLRGETLAQLVERCGPLPTHTALRLVDAAARALEYVHAAGTLHRDIKPDNIVLTDDGRIVLIDFGAARDFSAARSQGYSIVVTPGFAPLECYAERARRGAYSDVYALSATLFFLLSGDAPPAASDRAMGVSLPQLECTEAWLARAIAAGLSIEVAKRPANVTAFRELLQGPSAAAFAGQSGEGGEESDEQGRVAERPFVLGSYLRAFKRTRPTQLRVPDSKPIGPLLHSISQAQPELPRHSRPKRSFQAFVANHRESKTQNNDREALPRLNALWSIVRYIINHGRW